MRDADTARRTDVAIHGGGLAGLTLALQLRQQHPELDVTVIERRAHPVREAAQVIVNGKPAGAVWRPPYTVDVTGLLAAGSNRIEVIGRGSREPVASNDTAEGRAKNRRVELDYVSGTPN